MWSTKEAQEYTKYLLFFGKNRNRERVRIKERSLYIFFHFGGKCFSSYGTHTKMPPKSGPEAKILLID